MRRMAALLRDRRGATAIEYGLIATFVALALVASFQSMGGLANRLFGTILSEWSSRI